MVYPTLKLLLKSRLKINAIFSPKDLVDNIICPIFAVPNNDKAQCLGKKIYRGIEQLAARRAHNPEVGGSSPSPATLEDQVARFDPLSCSICSGLTLLSAAGVDPDGHGTIVNERDLHICAKFARWNWAVELCAEALNKTIV